MTDFALALQGTVILPDRILRSGYVAVADGRIAEVGQGHPPSASESHRLGEALILPVIAPPPFAGWWSTA